jgi:hypothetical protein
MLRPGWRDNRHQVEVENDLRIAAVRTGQTIEASKKLDAVLTAGIPEGRQMSLRGKMKALTESAEDFTKETHATLDGIAEKIATAKIKREEAAVKHHAYYDDIIASVEESTTAIDRLSNGPLDKSGQG